MTENKREQTLDRDRSSRSTACVHFLRRDGEREERGTEQSQIWGLPFSLPGKFPPQYILLFYFILLKYYFLLSYFLLFYKKIKRMGEESREKTLLRLSLRKRMGFRGTIPCECILIFSNLKKKKKKKKIKTHEW